MKPLKLHTAIVAFLLSITTISFISCEEKNETEPPLPVVDFQVSLDTVLLGDEVSFTDLSTNDPLSWKWFFGDGTTSEEQNPTHVYSNTGKYSVFLEVTNAYGETNLTKEDFVHVVDILTTNTKSTDFDLWVDDIIANMYVNGAYSGISAAFIDGDNVKKYHYGVKKKSTYDLADDQTLYQIASITKTITGLTTLQWLTNNDISLDASILDYVPEDIKPNLVKNNIEISFRDLLTHRSGLSRNSFSVFDCTFEGQDSTGIYNYIKINELERDPGTTPTDAVNYSNLGFALLGTILERQLDKPVGESMNDFVLNELNMTSTTMGHPDNFQNIAYPYGGFGNPQSSCNEKFAHFGPAYDGAGGLLSNLNDMIEYCKFLLSNDANAEMNAALLTSIESQYNYGDGSMCQPWFELKTDLGNTFYAHSGGLFGVSSLLVFSRTENKGVVLFTNYWVTNSDWVALNQMAWDFIDGTMSSGRIENAGAVPLERN